ncbi:MAG: phage holin family protein [Tepidisphaeraceae bacterium]
MDLNPGTRAASYGQTDVHGPDVDNGHTDVSGEPVTEAFRQAASRIGELKEYASYYASAKVDGVKASLRRLLVYAALGVVAGLAGAALAVTACVLTLVGLARLINSAAQSAWLGQLLVGLGVLLIMGVGAFVGMSMMTKASKNRTVAKYELRQRKQRDDFGHDVAQRTAAEGKVSV